MSVQLEMHEIRSRKEFDGVKLARTGVIVNVDTPTSKVTAHPPWCGHLRAADFEMKVIEHEGRTGGYYYFLRADDAEQALGAQACNQFE